MNHLAKSRALSVVLLMAAAGWSPAALGGKNEPPGDKTVGDKKGDSPPPKKEESPSTCVKHTEQARYVNGFDHLVHVTNECSKDVSCEVSTDVNPKPEKIALAPGATTTVLTFRGSPARTFQAKVECVFLGPTK